VLKSIAYKHKDMPVCFLEVLSQILVINDKVFRCQIDRFFHASSSVFLSVFRRRFLQNFFSFLISDDC
jgi:hypothetical protein